MKLVAPTQSILNLYSSIELGTIKIRTQVLVDILGKPEVFNDDMVLWNISIEDKNINSYQLVMRFNGINTNIFFDITKVSEFEVSTDNKDSKLETLKEFICQEVLDIVEKKK